MRGDRTQIERRCLNLEVYIGTRFARSIIITQGQSGSDLLVVDDCSSGSYIISRLTGPIHLKSFTDYETLN